MRDARLCIEEGIGRALPMLNFISERILAIIILWAGVSVMSMVSTSADSQRCSTEEVAWGVCLAITVVGDVATTAVSDMRTDLIDRKESSPTVSPSQEMTGAPSIRPIKGRSGALANSSAKSG